MLMEILGNDSFAMRCVGVRLSSRGLLHRQALDRPQAKGVEAEVVIKVACIVYAVSERVAAYTVCRSAAPLNTV